MTVADISPGTVLVAGSTGWKYTVQSVTDGTVVASGPRGPLTVGVDELQQDIARGAIDVR
jgi:hypothetical protein